MKLNTAPSEANLDSLPGENSIFFCMDPTLQGKGWKSSCFAQRAPMYRTDISFLPFQYEKHMISSSVRGLERFPVYPANLVLNVEPFSEENADNSNHSPVI